jgi:hypothetical protein
MFSEVHSSTIISLFLLFLFCKGNNYLLQIINPVLLRQKEDFAPQHSFIAQQ